MMFSYSQKSEQLPITLIIVLHKHKKYKALWAYCMRTFLFSLLRTLFYQSSKVLSPDKYFFMVFDKKDELQLKS